MKKTLLFALALIAVAPVAVEAQQDLDELVRQGDTYLKRGLIRRNSLRPYTGDVVRYRESYCSPRNRLSNGECSDWGTAPKSQITLRGNLRDGKWHGRWESFTSGVNGRYNMGQKCGVWGEQFMDGQQALRRCGGDRECFRVSIRIVDKRYPAC